MFELQQEPIRLFSCYSACLSKKRSILHVFMKFLKRQSVSCVAVYAGTESIKRIFICVQRWTKRKS